jgi:hypothetical protein
MKKRLTSSASKAKLLRDPRVSKAEREPETGWGDGPAVYVELTDGWVFDDGAACRYEDTWIDAWEAVEYFAERKAAA